MVRIWYDRIEASCKGWICAKGGCEIFGFKDAVCFLMGKRCRTHEETSTHSSPSLQFFFSLTQGQGENEPQSMLSVSRRTLGEEDAFEVGGGERGEGQCIVETDNKLIICLNP